MTDFDEFESRAVYTLEGWVSEDVDENEFTKATQASITTEATLEYDEMLRASIVNLDAWLNPNWKERFTNEFKISDEKTFIPDSNETSLTLDIRGKELIEGAKARAAEDNTEAAYVLGGWAYQAKKADHISSTIVFEGAFERVSNQSDQPDDATMESYDGGRNE